ncbi:distal tail protein Dit [Clostridium sp. DJ247]|uniref:distal tail protein Dit n=1 Tax=Clostridium sp. DJ247 TaxID=2726188 RepID=UPI0016294E95|nr:distal tail protein Dit [Clostridium sp. DJ247]MBC2578751.1 phage tail protein [Clostridium sp. DJ247]
MLPYFIFNGENSSDNNIIVNKLPDIERPKARVEKLTVSGRNGYLTQSDGTYEGVIKTVECTLNNGNIEHICSWLNGTGEAIFSNEPDKKYKAVIINAIPFNEILSKLHKFVVVFDCQPFKYKVDEPLITVISSNTTVINEGTFQSELVIKIYGSGDLSITINSETVSIKNVNEYVTVDSVLKDCYKDDVLKNFDMTGDFPVFNCGDNVISFSGSVMKIEIQVNAVWI